MFSRRFLRLHCPATVRYRNVGVTKVASKRSNRFVLTEDNTTKYIPEESGNASIEQLVTLNAESLEALNEKIALDKSARNNSPYYGDQSFDTQHDIRVQAASEMMNRNALRMDDLQVKVQEIGAKSRNLNIDGLDLEKVETVDDKDQSDTKTHGNMGAEPEIDPSKPFGKFTARNRPDSARRRNLAVRFSEYGHYVADGIHGKRENYSPRAEYLGSQHEQTSLWWAEAKELEDALPIDDLINRTGTVIEQLDQLPFSTDQKRIVIRETLKTLTNEIALRFPKKRIFVTDKFVEQVTVALAGCGVNVIHTDMSYSVRCPLTGATLDDQYTFTRDHLARYLMLLYRIISVSRNAQKDLMSHRYKRQVTEFDQLIGDFLEFADHNVVDVIIDLPNFLMAAIARGGKRNRDDKITSQMQRQYLLELLTSAKTTEGDKSVLSAEDKQNFKELILEGLKVVVAERRKLARLQGDTKVNVLLVAQRTSKKNPNFAELLVDLQQMDEQVQVNALFAPRFTVKFGRKRKFNWNEIEQNEDRQILKVPFDDFYVLLGACLFDDALLISKDNFSDMFPHNLKRGKMGIYSVLMSPARAVKEDAEVIDTLRDDWRKMLRPHFKDAVLFDLIQKMKGIKSDYLKRRVAVRPQYQDGLIFLPFREEVEGEGKLKFDKWAICNLK